MSSDPSFSIIVINYNYAQFLPQSIRSALDQDYKNFEVIVVDDASTDASGEVIESFGDQIRSVRKTVNKGHGDGFNQGFAAARGEVVLFLDADDFLYPNALSVLAQHHEAHVSQYHWRMKLVDAVGQPIDMYPAPEIALDDGDVSPALLRSGRYSTTVTSGLAFSRTALEKVLPMDAESFRQGGDGYLVTVAPLYGHVKLIPGALSAYRLHGANHSQFDAAIAKRARWRMEHDLARIASLERHAILTQREMKRDPALDDLLHLTERIASLRLDAPQHPIKTDRPQAIALRGLKLTLTQKIGLPRKAIFSAWWLVAGFGPKRVAQSLIAWRIFAPSRPVFVQKGARRLRALLRKRDAGDSAG